MSVSTTDINPVFKYSVLTIPATLLVIAPNFADPINLPKLLALITLSFTALTLFISLIKIEELKERNKKIRLVAFVYLTLLITMTASGVLGNGNYIRNLFGTTGRNNGLLYYVSALTIVILLLSTRIRSFEMNYLHKVLKFTSVIFGAYSVIQLFGLDPISWSNPYNPIIATLGNPNFSSSALASFAIYWLYFFAHSSGNSINLKFINLASASVFAFLSWRTNSLQGLVVLGLGIMLILFVALRERIEGRWIAILFFIGGGLILLFSFASFLGFGPLGEAFEQYTLKLRGWYAWFGLKAMFDSPVFGIGVDNYIYAFRKYRTEDFVSQYGFSVASNNAHSTPAQIGATFGIVVFLLYCLIHFLILFHALKILNSRDEKLRTYKGIAILWILILSQSLLSIEIIGLGIVNWILGAIILSSSISNSGDDSEEYKKVSKSHQFKALPAWTGSIVIASLIVGSIPTILISREEQAFSIVTRTAIIDEDTKVLVKENFQKLTSVTLLAPDKVDQVLGNLSQAGMSVEIQSTVKNLYKVDTDDAFANDLIAAYYKNVGMTKREIEIRESLRRLDPLNYWLEIALARAYAQVGDSEKLNMSINLIERLAPGSQEYNEALSLRNSLNDGS
jgi:hypothetical protein